MIYRLNDGTYEFMMDNERQAKLHDLLRDKLGEEIADCLDDVIDDLINDCENAALEYIQRKLLHPINILSETVIPNMDTLRTNPNALRGHLKTIDKELAELDEGHGLVGKLKELI